MNNSAPLDIPVCSCGHNRHHPGLDVQCKYSWKAYAVMTMGISAPPSEVHFKCSDCGETIEITRDKDICNSFRYRGGEDSTLDE